MGRNRSGKRTGMQRRGGHSGGNNKPGRKPPGGAGATNPVKPNSGSNNPGGTSNSSGK